MRIVRSGTERCGGFDLYVLDVVMPDLNGIEAGRTLRALGTAGEIIYLSQVADYAPDSYDVQAFYYLLKPIDEARFASRTRSLCTRPRLRSWPT